MALLDHDLYTYNMSTCCYTCYHQCWAVTNPSNVPLLYIFARLVSLEFDRGLKIRLNRVIPDLYAPAKMVCIHVVSSYLGFSLRWRVRKS